MLEDLLTDVLAQDTLESPRSRQEMEKQLSREEGAVLETEFIP